RFQDINGEPLKRSVNPPPLLLVTLPEGVPAQKDSLVLIRAPQEGDKVKDEAQFKLQKELAGKQGKVTEVLTSRDPGGAEKRELKVTVFLDEKRKQTTTLTVDAGQVDVVSEPLKFVPKLGEPRKGESIDEANRMEARNNGDFKVSFQPRAAGE